MHLPTILPRSGYFQQHHRRFHCSTVGNSISSPISSMLLLLLGVPWKQKFYATESKTTFQHNFFATAPDGCCDIFVGGETRWQNEWNIWFPRRWMELWIDTKSSISGPRIRFESYTFMKTSQMSSRCCFFFGERFSLSVDLISISLSAASHSQCFWDKRVCLAQEDWEVNCILFRCSGDECVACEVKAAYKWIGELFCVILDIKISSWTVDIPKWTLTQHMKETLCNDLKSCCNLILPIQLHNDKNSNLPFCRNRNELPLSLCTTWSRLQLISEEFRESIASSKQSLQTKIKFQFHSVPIT